MNATSAPMRWPRHALARTVHAHQCVYYYHCVSNRWPLTRAHSHSHAPIAFNRANRNVQLCSCASECGGENPSSDGASTPRGTERHITHARRHTHTYSLYVFPNATRGIFRHSRPNPMGRALTSAAANLCHPMARRWKRGALLHIMYSIYARIYACVCTVRRLERVKNANVSLV